VSEARRFGSGAVASPHYLASLAGARVLASGGNALDAAIATNLTLAVVTPYLCGVGGDLFAIVWDGSLAAYNGSGRAAGAATPAAVRAAAGADALPALGPLTVTVPGAVGAWFTLLERYGTRSFRELAEPARAYAQDGFPLTRAGASAMTLGRDRYRAEWGWAKVYADATAGARFRQPALARTIATLAEQGPEPFYRGEIARAIADHLQSLGGLIDVDDLADHHGDWVATLSTTYRDVEVHEMPPNSQGVAALEALNVVAAIGALPTDPAACAHTLIEAVKLALADRNAYVTDPEHMTIAAADLAAKAWARPRALRFDPGRAQPLAAGAPVGGGTAYLCAADGNGMCVSLIQSNYVGFGSGVTVPGWGINLQNRGAYFSLDPRHVNVVAPRKRTMHTLMPALALRAGRPWLVFGTMGGDGQAQTQVQVLTRIVDDRADPQDAIDAPRWVVSPADGSVMIEGRAADEVVDGLRARGHVVATTRPFDRVMGHAHAIAVDDEGYAVAFDPRSEGAATGV
jgi:gamma-glutamyltranspeptidase/glutathione hydrolase